jgi:hypothetical protein
MEAGCSNSDIVPPGDHVVPVIFQVIPIQFSVSSRQIIYPAQGLQTSKQFLVDDGRASPIRRPRFTYPVWTSDNLISSRNSSSARRLACVIRFCFQAQLKTHESHPCMLLRHWVYPRITSVSLITCALYTRVYHRPAGGGGTTISG